MKKQRKSPLREDPLRLPGQSLDESIQNVRDNTLLDRIVYVSLFSVITLLEWYRWYLDVPYSPWLFTVLLIVVVAIATPGLFRGVKQIRTLKTGRDGERAVGQVLERLRVNGYHLYHDIIDPDWNVDHVLVGPGGVFAIETKTYSKPVRGKAVIRYSAQGLFKEGLDISQCLDQVLAEAGSIKRIIGEHSGKTFDVQPVLAFPGWFIESERGQRKTVWVLNPKALLKWVRGARPMLSEEQIGIVRKALSTHSRSSYRRSIT